MRHSIDNLISIASEPIGEVFDGTEALNKWGRLGNELAEMLKLKNGFYAYESALLVRPVRHDHAPLGLLEWNDPRRWKAEYADNLGSELFFAEDVFGGQYCIRDDSISTFDPETGLFEAMCPSLRTWAGQVMSDFQMRTGYPLAHDWQMVNGALPLGVRLLPKKPFVCGGRYELDNLYSLVDVEGMRYRASIANQIRALPDGAEIVFKTRDDTPLGM